MSQVLVDAALLKRASELLSAQLIEAHAMAKTAEDIQTRLAAAEGVLDLIASGVVDPLDGRRRLEEYTENPEMLQLTKRASDLGVSAAPSLGHVNADTGSVGGDSTPEDRFWATLSGLIDH